MREIDISQAAHHLLKVYGEGAEVAAARKADKALEAGDAFNFNLWKSVTEVVRELERGNPSVSGLMN